MRSEASCGAGKGAQFPLFGACGQITIRRARRALHHPGESETKIVSLAAEADAVHKLGSRALSFPTAVLRMEEKRRVLRRQG